MADRKISDHSAHTGAGAASGDLIEVVDVSDTTDAATGTNKKMTLAEVADAVARLGNAGEGLWAGGIAGEYVVFGVPTGTRTMTEARLLATPYWVPYEVSIDRLAVRVASAGGAGSVTRLGIYADDRGLPGALLLDAGTVASDGTGVKEVTVSATLGPGRFWLATCQQGGFSASGLQGAANSVTFNSHLLTGGGLDSLYTSHYRSSVTGALPNPFDSTRTNNKATDAIAFRVRLA